MPKIFGRDHFYPYKYTHLYANTRSHQAMIGGKMEKARRHPSENGISESKQEKKLWQKKCKLTVKNNQHYQRAGTSSL